MIFGKKNLLAGLAGSIVLNVVHETAKKAYKDAPRVDKIGEEAVSKSIRTAGYDPPRGNKLFVTALVSDVIANSIYYSLIGTGKKENLLLRGLLYGTAAGVGALALTKPLGLNDEPVNKTNITKVLTVGWYVLGGVVTAATLTLLRKKR